MRYLFATVISKVAVALDSDFRGSGSSGQVLANENTSKHFRQHRPSVLRKGNQPFPQGTDTVDFHQSRLNHLYLKLNLDNAPQFVVFMSGLWTLCVRQNLTVTCQTLCHFTPANLKADSVPPCQVPKLALQSILASEYLV